MSKTGVRIYVVIAMVLVMMTLCASPASAWEKMGVFEGNITAVHRTTSAYYVATEGSGVYRSLDRENWLQIVSGLEELEIVAITSHPDYPARLYCASATVLYYSNDSGTTWSRFSQIPVLGNMVRITSLYCTPCGSTSYLYVGTYGRKIWRLNLLSYVWVQITGSCPARVLSLGGFISASSEYYIFAGTEYDPVTQSINPGGIWRIIDNCSGDFSASLRYGAGTSWPSIAAHLDEEPGGGIGMILSGSDGSGIAFSIDSGDSFLPYCQSPPAIPAPAGRFQALDFFGDNSGTPQFYGLAGTENMLYCLSGDIFHSCSDGYDELGFYGNMSAIGVYTQYNGIFGTHGKGLFTAGQALPFAQTICETYTSISRTQIPHQHVNRIKVSPNYLTDDTIFLASRSEGVYKSVGTGPDGGREFTRYFCHPNAYGPVDILSLALIPGYNDNGTAWSNDFSNDKVVLAGSNGYGVFLSRDGGASWYGANYGEMPADAIVMDVEYPLSARTDGVAFAAVSNRGLYISLDRGVSWALIPCTSNLQIWDISIPYDFVYGSSDYCSVWAATTEGIRHIYQSGGVWTCALRSTSPLNPISAWRIDVTKSGADTLVFFGTPANGVVLGKWTGSQWTELPFADTQLPANAKIKDLELSGWFTSGDEFVVLYALAYQTSEDMLYGTVYHPSTELFTGWNPVAVPVTAVNRFTTISLGPDYTPWNAGPVFIGHPFLGMASRQTGSSSWVGCSGYYAYPHEVTATAVDPEFPNLLLSGTSDMGMFISYDGGDSACPFGRYLDYLLGSDWHSTTSVTSIAISDSMQVLFETGFESPPSLYGWTIDDGDGDGISWLWQDGSAGYYGMPITACPSVFSGTLPYMQVDSDCAGASVTMNEGLITSSFDCTTFSTVYLEFDHFFRSFSGNEKAVVYVKSSVNPYWQEVASYSTSTSNSEHVILDLSQWAIGDSDFQIKFSYENANYDWYWFIDNVKIWGYVNYSTNRNAVIGTEGHGIYYTTYSNYPDTHSIAWQRSSSPSNELFTATVSDISYESQENEMWASIEDNPNFSIAAPSFVSTDLGQSWNQIFGGVPYDTMFTAIAFDRSGLKAADAGSSFNRLANSGKAQSVFLWAASGGDKIPPYKSSQTAVLKSSKAGAAGAYRYDKDADTWTLRNGTGDHSLNTDLYYTTILSTSSGLVFIGGWTDDSLSSNFSGLWRSADEGLTWHQVNAGLDAHLNAKQITSLLEADNGDLLLGVNDSTYGGVFLSDSDGFSWVRVDDFTSDRGVNAISQSKTMPTVYYASMVADGSQRTVDLTVTGNPVPEFLVDNDPATLADMTWPADHQKWFIGMTGVSYTIQSVSAGTLAGSTTYSWNIEGTGWVDTGTISSTSYTFLTGGEKTIVLRLDGNSSLERTHHIFILDTTPPPIPDGNLFGSGMTVRKNAVDGSSLIVEWDDSCDPELINEANIIYGSIAAVGTYAIDGAECSVTPTHTWNIGVTDNIWFVVVSDNNDFTGDDTEGSWGTDSSGQERTWLVLGVPSPSNQCGCTMKNSTGSCDAVKATFSR